jgi:Na+-driven multidrug efflux pump
MSTPESDLTRTWRRSRWWATSALIALALASALTFVYGHWLHGVLMALGAALLIKGSVFGRRSRRAKWVAAEASVPMRPMPERRQAPRKAA